MAQDGWEGVSAGKVFSRGNTLRIALIEALKTTRKNLYDLGTVHLFR
jgi:hypothetical protein